MIFDNTYMNEIRELTQVPWTQTSDEANDLRADLTDQKAKRAKNMPN